MAKEKIYTGPEVIDLVADYMSQDDVDLVKQAYQFAEEAHKEQVRKSGEPYIIHPIQVAAILAQLHMDQETVSAGFLHDVVEDTTVTLDELAEYFGQDVASIVDGVTKLGKFKYKSHEEQQAENHRKMLLAMAQDLRVILVKLADRLHNMRTLKFLRDEKRRRIAKETLEIYAPLAHRLGISRIKWELEDTALRYLKPKQYYKIVHLMKTKRKEREVYIKEMCAEVKEETDGLGIEAEIYGRPKHIYSIYRKMVDQKKDFSEIYDLSAIRVIVDNIKECYTVLGAIHSHWTPMPKRFKDYIAMPKANMYQSLHTTVVGPNGKPIEIQIRTKEMHKVAEFGIAAHWAYKEHASVNADKNTTDKQLDWFREIIELQNTSKDASEFMESVKGDIFKDKVYVFTPSGDVKELPQGSSPIDFAYSIHTDIGNQTTGSVVNGKMVPLNYKLQNGDIVEILTSKQSFGPGQDWLNYVVTTRAKNKIRHFFKMRDAKENELRGRELLDRAFAERKLASKDYIDEKALQPILAKLSYNHFNELLIAIGMGEVKAESVMKKLVRDTEQKEQQDKTPKVAPRKLKMKDNGGVVIQGMDSLLVRMSHCCNPVPFDEIKGYITKGRGISIHRADCSNIISAEPERTIEVEWADEVTLANYGYQTDVEIIGENRDGLLNDILQAIRGLSVSLISVNAKPISSQIAKLVLSLQVNDKYQLCKTVDKIKTVPHVDSVKRLEQTKSE